MIDESTLTKAQLRKLNSLRRSLGTSIANRAFNQWLKAEQKKKERPVADDPVARKIQDALVHLGNINLSRYGYTIKRGKGRADKGIQVTKNERPD